MSLKDKLYVFKETLKSLFDEYNEDDDFNATFEDHEIGDSKYYCLHYINYHNIDRDPNRRGMIDWRYKPFELPNGMSREETFKVLSYLTNFIEKRPDVYEASWKSVGTLDNVLNLERFGFKRLDFTPSEDEVIDLFTIDGRIKRFLDSGYYSKYFNWYTPNISREEVVAIYQKYGMTFRDIIWLDKSQVTNTQEKEKSSILIRQRTIINTNKK